MALPLVRRAKGKHGNLPSAADIQKVLKTITVAEVMKEAVDVYKALFPQGLEGVFAKVAELLEQYANNLEFASKDNGTHWAGEMPTPPNVNILAGLAKQAETLMGKEPMHLKYFFNVRDDSYLERGYMASQCGLIKMSQDPTQASMESLKTQLQGKDAVIVANNELFYATQPMNEKDPIRVNKIPETQENKAELTRLKAMTTDDYQLAKPDALALIESVADGFMNGTQLKDPERLKAMDAGFNAWLSSQQKTMQQGIVYEATKDGSIQMDKKGQPVKASPEALRALIVDADKGYAAYVNKNSDTLVLTSEEYVHPSATASESAGIRS